MTIAGNMIQKEERKRKKKKYLMINGATENNSNDRMVGKYVGMRKIAY